MLRKLTAALFAMALVFLALGCSGWSEDKKCDEKDPTKEARKVSGKVTYDGKTVPVGTITFHPAKGRGVMVEIENGKFTADRLPRSPVTVTVSTAIYRAQFESLKRERSLCVIFPQGGVKEEVEDLDGMKGMTKAMEKEMAEVKEKMWEKLKDMIDVPEQFADPKTSGLSYTIQFDSQEINIDIPKQEKDVKNKHG